MTTGSWGFEFVEDPTAYFVDALPLSLNVTFALGSQGTVQLKEYKVTDGALGSYVFYDSRLDKLLQLKF